MEDLARVDLRRHFWVAVSAAAPTVLRAIVIAVSTGHQIAITWHHHLVLQQRLSTSVSRLRRISLRRSFPVESWSPTDRFPPPWRPLPPPRRLNWKFFAWRHVRGHAHHFNRRVTHVNRNLANVRHRWRQHSIVLTSRGIYLLTFSDDFVFLTVT